MLKTVVLVTVLAGCGAAHRGYGAAKVAVIDCGKQDAPSIASALARWGVEAAIAGKVDWKTIETAATGLGLGVGSCAYAEFLRAYRAKPTVQALAVGAPQDDGSAGLARLAKGAQVRLADGTVL